jgi:hypothetical protein
MTCPGGALIEPEHPPAYGVDEIAHRMRRHGIPVLALSSQPAIPGAVLRPIVDPVPLYPWSMIWLRHPGLGRAARGGPAGEPDSALPPRVRR